MSVPTLDERSEAVTRVGWILFAHAAESAVMPCVIALCDAGYSVSACEGAEDRPCYRLEQGSCPVATRSERIVYSVSPVWQRDAAGIRAELGSAYPESRLTLQFPDADESRLRGRCLLASPPGSGPIGQATD